MTMLVLAVFAVGSVSAAEDVATDIDVPTEEIEIDDSVVDEVEIDDVTEDADVDDNSGNIRSSDIHVNNGMTLDQIQGNISNAADGSTIYFDSGNYADISLTLRSNVIYSGYGATLIGTGTNHIFNLPNYMDNFTIAGFTLDVNNATGASSAIYGSFITNGIIANNTMYDGANGININKYYDNMTVENNIIYDMNNDGISFAAPITFNPMNIRGYTYISGNMISECSYGIFIGGNFKGEIIDNEIDTCEYGIQFLGKPNGQMGNILAEIADNNIYDVAAGIEIINMTVIILYIDNNNITTLNNDTNYTINYKDNVTVASDGELLVEDNYLDGAIKRSFIRDIATEFANFEDGNIKENE